MADNDNNKKLYYLHELSDYKVADGYCDVRGWEVKDADNHTIGKVDNLLVNKETERVVYLDVEVDKSIIEEGHKANLVSASKEVYEFPDKNGEDHIIVPVGMVDLDKKSKKVQTNKITYETFAQTARFNKGADIDRIYELIILNTYVPDNNLKDSNTTDDSFYNRKEFHNSSGSSHS